MKMTILLISILLLLLIGCGPRHIYPTISNYVGSRDFSKYRNIAVFPFADAPGAPQSGQIVQGLAGQIFAQSGFVVAERARLYNILGEQQLSSSGLIETSEAVRIGRLLGVKAIVIGEVGQYSVMQRHTDTTYFPVYLYGQTSYLPIQGQQWAEAHVSLSLRVIDVETSQLIYSGSGQYDRGLKNPPQQLAENILKDIIVRWVRDPNQMRVSQQQAASSKSIENHQKIVDDANKAIERNPRNVTAYLNRSIGYAKTGKYKLAIEDANTVIDLDQTNSKAYANRSFCHLRLKNYQQAIEDANKSIELEPNNPIAYANRGAAYLYLGVKEQGIDDQKTAARLGEKTSQNYLRSQGIIW
jgi:tetratricopeptide (TPR) repeat protein